METSGFYSIGNHHKCLSQLFPIHLNTYVIRLRPLEILAYASLERDMAQWLERGAVPMTLPAVQFQIPLVQDFQRNIMFLPSQSWDIVKMVCPWARHFTLKCFT